MFGVCTLRENCKLTLHALIMYIVLLSVLNIVKPRQQMTQSNTPMIVMRLCMPGLQRDLEYDIIAYVTLRWDFRTSDLSGSQQKSLDWIGRML